MKLLARRVWRIGVESVWVDQHGQHFAELRNRTYYSRHPIPPESAERRIAVLRRGRA